MEPKDPKKRKPKTVKPKTVKPKTKTDKLKPFTVTHGYFNVGF